MKNLCGLATRVQSFQVAAQKVKVSILKQMEAIFPFIYPIGNGCVRLECMYAGMCFQGSNRQRVGD